MVIVKVNSRKSKSFKKNKKVIAGEQHIVIKCTFAFEKNQDLKN